MATTDAGAADTTDAGAPMMTTTDAEDTSIPMAEEATEAERKQEIDATMAQVALAMDVDFTAEQQRKIAASVVRVETENLAEAKLLQQVALVHVAALRHKYRATQSYIEVFQLAAPVVAELEETIEALEMWPPAEKTVEIEAAIHKLQSDLAWFKFSASEHATEGYAIDARHIELVMPGAVAVANASEAKVKACIGALNEAILKQRSGLPEAASIVPESVGHPASWMVAGIRRGVTLPINLPARSDDDDDDDIPVLVEGWDSKGAPVFAAPPQSAPVQAANPTDTASAPVQAANTTVFAAGCLPKRVERATRFANGSAEFTSFDYKVATVMKVRTDGPSVLTPFQVGSFDGHKSKSTEGISAPGKILTWTIESCELPGKQSDFDVGVIDVSRLYEARRGLFVSPYLVKSLTGSRADGKPLVRRFNSRVSVCVTLDCDTGTMTIKVGSGQPVVAFEGIDTRKSMALCIYCHTFDSSIRISDD